MSNRTKLSAAIAAVFAVIVVGGSVIGTAGATSESAGNQLAGTWTATIERPGLPSFSSLQVYTGEGSLVESGSDSGLRSPQYGSWKRLGGREYAATGVIFRFDSQNRFIGRAKVNRTIELAKDGQSFTFQGGATLTNPDGVVVARFSASGSAQRMQVEEQP